MIDMSEAIQAWEAAERAFQNAILKTVNAHAQIKNNDEKKAFQPIMAGIKKNASKVRYLLGLAKDLQNELRKIGGAR